jgi:glutamate decarboxylase
MVHLSSVLNNKPAWGDSEAEEPAPAPRKVEVELANYVDEFTTSVYGSRFANEGLPKNRMPENPMPKDIAYRMIKDELSLDNNPKLKCVSLFLSRPSSDSILSFLVSWC